MKWKRNKDSASIEYRSESGIRIVRGSARPYYEAHYPRGDWEWNVGRSATEAKARAEEICTPEMLEK